MKCIQKLILRKKKKENKCNNLFPLYKTELPIYYEQM